MSLQDCILSIGKTKESKMKKQERFYSLLKLIGKNISIIREFRKMSIGELSIQTGIRIEYLKKIEQGNAYRLNITKFFRIAKVLNVNGSCLVDKNCKEKFKTIFYN